VQTRGEHDHPRKAARAGGAARNSSASPTACAKSAQDWRTAARSETTRVDVQPELAIADGALSFWKTAGEVRPTTREQRCWVHKTANVLGKLPKSQQPKAKRALQEIWMAETKADAEAAFDAFIESQVKYEKAQNA
jgi:putative transposase